MPNSAKIDAEDEKAKAEKAKAEAKEREELAELIADKVVVRLSGIEAGPEQVVEADASQRQ